MQQPEEKLSERERINEVQEQAEERGVQVLRTVLPLAPEHGSR